MDITNPEEWAAGDVAVIRNQEAKKVRDIGSLIFETPIQHDYEEGVEVRSLLSSEEQHAPRGSESSRMFFALHGAVERLVL